MSHIQSSRMPHVYGEPSTSDDQDGLRDGVRDVARRIGERAEDVPKLGWLLGAVGAGIVGAGLYAAFAGSPKTKAPAKAPGRRRTTKAKTTSA